MLNKLFLKSRNLKRYCLFFVGCMLIMNAYASAKTDSIVLNLVHLYDFSYGGWGSGKNRPGIVLFRNPVQYIINNIDTIMLLPKRGRPFSDPLSPFDVYRIVAPADSSIRVRLICYEDREHIDTTYVLLPGQKPPGYMLFAVFPNHFSWIRKRNRATCYIFGPPYINRYLKREIPKRMERSVKRVIFIGERE